MSVDGKWMYSLEPEAFHSFKYDTKEEAEAAGREMNAEEKGATLYVGQLKLHDPFASRSVEYAIEALVERLQEDADEECGECAEGWLENVNKNDWDNLEKVVSTVLKTWMNGLGLMPAFGTIENMYEVTI